VELANYLLSTIGETTEYARESRHQRVAPHLGRVELATTYRGELSRPLPSVLDATAVLAARVGSTTVENQCSIDRRW
jgi:hypothetical protein